MSDKAGNVDVFLPKVICHVLLGNVEHWDDEVVGGCAEQRPILGIGQTPAVLAVLLHKLRIQGREGEPPPDGLHRRHLVKAPVPGFRGWEDILIEFVKLGECLGEPLLLVPCFFFGHPLLRIPGHVKRSQVDALEENAEAAFVLAAVVHDFRQTRPLLTRRN